MEKDASYRHKAREATKEMDSEHLVVTERYMVCGPSEDP